ncbi:MAG: hypothetical protein HFH85_19700 [Lachnospiraceae bacterium]|nr:hypothetical protein [Lachnospiraceae bacterium]
MKTELGEKILAKCDKSIRVMEQSATPPRMKEKLLKEKQVCREILEVICGTQEVMTPSAAICILNEAKRIIEETVMCLEI